MWCSHTPWSMRTTETQPKQLPWGLNINIYTYIYVCILMFKPYGNCFGCVSVVLILFIYIYTIYIKSVTFCLFRRVQFFHSNRLTWEPVFIALQLNPWKGSSDFNKPVDNITPLVMTFTTAISKTRDKLDQIIGVQKDPYVDLALRARLVLGWILSCAHFISDLYLNWFMRGFTTTADN